MPDKLTNSFGRPVADDQNTVTAGSDGPALMQDTHLLDKLAHFDRERIPERVVHAKGAGAYGYFEVTSDVSQYTKAAFLSEVGKRTDLFVRFSTVGGEKGSADSERDPRGFAVKFYTEHGNYEMVGNNTPVFFIRDPLKFPDFIHTQKRNPATNLKDPDMFWDFLSLTPESLHQVTILFSDRGTPKSYRFMNGYTSHTYLWYTDTDRYWIKLHFKTGVWETLRTRESGRFSGMERWTSQSLSVRSPSLRARSSTISASSSTATSSDSMGRCGATATSSRNWKVHSTARAGTSSRSSGAETGTRS